MSRGGVVYRPLLIGLAKGFLARNKTTVTIKSTFSICRLICALVAVVALCAAPSFAAKTTKNKTAPAAPRCPRAVVLDLPTGCREVYKRDECRCLLDIQKPLETESDIRGWWLMSQDLYFNGNVGSMAADIISDTLKRECLFEMFPREDLRRILADKRDILKEKLNVSGDKLDAAVAKIDPVKLGRELGVDFVVLGHICSAETRHSRSAGYFNTTLAFSVVIVNVHTCRPVFQFSYGGQKGRYLQYGAFEYYAGILAGDIRKHMETGVMPRQRIMQREP